MLPDVIRDEPQLEALLAHPSAADIAFASSLTDGVLVLGAGGKMGPSLARRVRRALDAAGRPLRVVAASRFSDRGLAAALEADGIECVAADLLDPASIEALPPLGNLLYLVGRKFGSTERPDLTWAHNTIVPALVARRFPRARIVAFSTGNVYAPVGPASPGCAEDDPLAPVGEYAQSCLGRERIFEHFSRENGTACLLFRLFYAVDLRYGTLVDLARKVFAGERVDLRVPRVNALWQGDASSYALRALALCEAPAAPLVVTGPEPVVVRDVAERFGRIYGRPPRFTGEEGEASLLGHPARCVEHLGPPEVDLERLIAWTAAWVAGGGRSLDKPTHFEATDGRF
jgi:nucleoside-diphosphate-sugar epimerase